MPPARAELPTTRQLLRSTIIAIFAAAAILVTIVLPQGSQPLPIHGKTRAANAAGEAQIVGRNAKCAASRAGICRHPANVEHGIAESRRVSSRRRIVADSAMRHGIVAIAGGYPTALSKSQSFLGVPPAAGLSRRNAFEADSLCSVAWCEAC